MSRKRTWARRCAAQAIYQWQLTDQEPAELTELFPADQDMAQADEPYFHDLVVGVITQVEELDARIAPYLVDRAMEQVDLVERAILRLGTYELEHHLGVPPRVVINECIELAKRFGAEEGHTYINGILDRVAKDVRGTKFVAAAK